MNIPPGAAVFLERLDALATEYPEAAAYKVGSLTAVIEHLARTVPGVDADLAARATFMKPGHS